METLLRNKDHIFNIKNKVENLDNSLYSHHRINNFKIDKNTISIVMTSSNRSEQVYFTLKTISDSIYKNVQVILVDDSDTDPIYENVLQEKKYPFIIELINIKRENKHWHNPLVNYNIGFKFILGGKVIIQNAEVCHIGDVVNFVSNHIITDKNYYVFDVKASLNFDTNKEIYKKNTSSIAIYNENLFLTWYQSEGDNNRNFHFLTALTVDTFHKIKEFSYDYTMGKWYDDNDFVLKIISQNINIINIYHNHCNIGGIHLFHPTSDSTWDNGVEMNNNIFFKKVQMYNSTREYVDVTNNSEEFENKYNKLLNI